MQRLKIHLSTKSQEVIKLSLNRLFSSCAASSKIYAITYTISPEILKTFPTGPVKTMKCIMKSYVNRTPFVNLELVVEKTKRGTPHFHGLLTLTNDKEYTKEDIIKYWPGTQVDIKPIKDFDNMQRWSQYCAKDFRTAAQLEVITAARAMARQPVVRQTKLPRVIWDAKM